MTVLVFVFFIAYEFLVLKPKQIEKMDKNNRLYGVVKKFSDINFDPNTVG